MINPASVNSSFRSAVVLSLFFHIALLVLIVFSPSLPKSSQKGMVHYVNLISLPGGGGPGGGGAGVSVEEETPVKKRETLKDLTTPQKIQERAYSALRHPVEKPKKEIKPKKEKKAVIREPQIKERSKSKSKEGGTGAQSGPGTGAGLRVGLGEGSGFGSGYASQIGLSSFPFTYYLQIIRDRVSSSWFTSLVDPGVSGYLHVTVRFKIFKNGQISDLEVEESSGIRSLDLSALRAIYKSASFPPLPKEYSDEFLLIRIIFEHSK
jgi:TonB family protein